MEKVSEFFLQATRLVDASYEEADASERLRAALALTGMMQNQANFVNCAQEESTGQPAGFIDNREAT